MLTRAAAAVLSTWIHSHWRGGHGLNHVRVKPPSVGERLLTVTVRTNSRVTPEVPLRIRVLGGRRPPFLFDVEGVLTFTESNRACELRVRTLQDAESNVPLSISADSQRISIQAEGFTNEPYGETRFVLRTYRYRVSLAHDWETGAIYGLVLVADPWDPQRLKQVPYSGRVTPAVRFFPSHPRLVRNLGESASPHVLLVVLTRDPLPQVHLEPLEGSLPGLTIQREVGAGSSKCHKFVLTASAEGKLRAGVSRSAFASRRTARPWRS